MNELARSTISKEKLVDKFNKAFPIGTRVRYWTGVREGVGRESVTKYAAALVSNQPCVWVEGVTGCIALTHVEPVPG